MRVVDGGVVPLSGLDCEGTVLAGIRLGLMRACIGMALPYAWESPLVQRARVSTEPVCESRVPLLFVRNMSSFMTDQRYAGKGIAKHDEKLVTAVAVAFAPRITAPIGDGPGTGNHGMCGRAYPPRFLFARPNVRIGTMGGGQAAPTLATVHRDVADWTPEEVGAFKARVCETHEAKADPCHATAHLGNEGLASAAPISERAQSGLFRS